MKIAIVTLGCDKNTVDAEHLAGLLDERGHEIAVEGPQDRLDALVLLTCGFIEDARAESLQTLLAYCEAKKNHGNPRRIVMAGCMAQRYGQEMSHELSEVDAFAGVGQPEALADLVEKIAAPPDATPQREGNPPPEIHPSSFILHPSLTSAPLMKSDHALPRKRLDSSPAAYLKIADGCDHACSFCAIPAMKGPYASVPREILLDEARGLLASGVREINLIAQDLAPYGTDLYPDYALPDLLSELCGLPGDYWVRLLYLYPAALTPRLLQVLAEEKKLCKYIDLPLQHLDPSILKAMRRPSGDAEALGRLAELRRVIPQIAIRTTMIVGFPGESRNAYQNLLKGIQEIEFERLGAFIFSPEEGTPAATLPNQTPEKVAARRHDRLMRTQAAISLRLQEKQVGRTLRVLIESVGGDPVEARGRSQREAPEVDGEIIFQVGDAPDPEALKRLRPGDFVEAEIVEADIYDLYARIKTGSIEEK